MLQVTEVFKICGNANMNLISSRNDTITVILLSPSIRDEQALLERMLIRSASFNLDDAYEDYNCSVEIIIFCHVKGLKMEQRAVIKL
jgi:hypothetical protein